MATDWLIGVILLGVLPGAAHAYSNSIAGLVASGVFAFFLLVAIVVLIIVSLLWNDWYRDRMGEKGYVKNPRRWWHFIDKSERRQRSTYAPSENIIAPLRLQTMNVEQVPESRLTTLNRSKSPDTWAVHLTEVPKYRTYEEKGQTIDFLPEEEPEIVTEVIDTGRQTTDMDRTNLRATHISMMEADQSQDIYIPDSSAPDSAPTNIQMEPTTLRSTTTSQPSYHVQLGRSGEHMLTETRQDNFAASTREPTLQQSVIEEASEPSRSRYGDSVVLF